MGKQEILIEDLQIALDRAGENCDLAILLKTKPKNVRGQQPRRIRASQYSPDLLKLVMKIEAEAIEKYGYDKLPQSILSDSFSHRVDKKMFVADKLVYVLLEKIGSHSYCQIIFKNCSRNGER